MSFKPVIRTVLLSSTAIITGITASASASFAATVALLQDGKSIVRVDSEKRTVLGKVDLADGATLVGIDVRPADGKLYGVTADGVIVTVDPMTGKWEKKSQLSEKLPSGGSFIVDFNPAADRLRLMVSDGTNFRVNVDDGKAIVDGKLKYSDSDKSKGTPPKITAGAYTNSYAGTKETALFNIDVGTGMLVKQAPPNDGILNGVGSLGVKVEGPVAFDILSDGAGGNVAWLLTGDTLHTVDLSSGAAKAVGAVAGLSGKTLDMAILPKN